MDIIIREKREVNTRARMHIRYIYADSLYGRALIEKSQNCPHYIVKSKQRLIHGKILVESSWTSPHNKAKSKQRECLLYFLIFLFLVFVMFLNRGQLTQLEKRKKGTIFWFVDLINLSVHNALLPKSSSIKNTVLLVYILDPWSSSPLWTWWPWQGPNNPVFLDS